MNTIEYETIEVALTPSKYLESNNRLARAKLVSTYSTISSENFKIAHDKYNHYDNFAVEIYYNKIFIGYIVKNHHDKYSVEEINNFCFQNERLRDISTYWDGKELYIQRKRTTEIIFEEEKLNNSQALSQAQQKCYFKKNLLLNYFRENLILLLKKEKTDYYQYSILDNLENNYKLTESKKLDNYILKIQEMPDDDLCILSFDELFTEEDYEYLNYMLEQLTHELFLDDKDEALTALHFILGSDDLEELKHTWSLSKLYFDSLEDAIDLFKMILESSFSYAFNIYVCEDKINLSSENDETDVDKSIKKLLDNTSLLTVDWTKPSSKPIFTSDDLYHSENNSWIEENWGLFLFLLFLLFLIIDAIS